MLLDKRGRALPLSAESGHRIEADWMGASVLTLEDLLRPGLRAVAIGINPAPISVAQGHYYQGLLGQRFYARLRQAGVISRGDDDWEDDGAFAAGIGFTDLIKRPTVSAKDLRPDEYAHGRHLLTEKLQRVRPELLIFTFKKAAETLFGRLRGNGFVEGLRFEGADVFLTPGPYESADTTRATLSRLAERWQRLS
jgi:TDG/mug DNA glycosylase family protein